MKIIKVAGCADCPYRELNRSGYFYECKKIYMSTIYGGSEAIGYLPKCPLEDATSDTVSNVILNQNVIDTMLDNADIIY